MVASSLEFVEFIAGQMDGAGRITFRKMFGEYGLYCDDKIIALICDDELFIKPTLAGRTFISDPCESPPYPGAKPYFLIDDRFEDKDWIGKLVKLTADDLPKPEKKLKSKPKVEQKLKPKSKLEPKSKLKPKS
jgi:TfoX/Sxy family transcriptional regulator of competence genes